MSPDPVVSLRWLVGESPLLARLFFASLELAGLALLVALLVRFGRIRSPRVISLLWLVVLVKPLVSLAVGSPIPITVLDAPSQRAEAPPVSRTVSPADSELPPMEGKWARDAVSGETRHDAVLYEEPATPVLTSGVEAAAMEPEPIPEVTGSSWPRALIVVWLAGVALFLGRDALERLRLHRILRDAATPPGAMTRRYREIAAELGLRHLPRLLLTEMLDSPAIVGLLRPTILVPLWMAVETEEAKLDWSLRHELVHWKWLDPLALLLREAARILFHFHPAAWWCGKRLVVALELACDRGMLRTRSEAGDYAEQLFQILARIRRHRRAPLATGLFATRTQVRKRIAALLDESFALAPQVTLRSGLGLAIVAAIALSVGGALRDEEDKATEQPAGAARVLHFPANRSLGSLLLQDEGYDWTEEGFIWSADRFTFEKWEYLGEAKGEVIIPAGKRVQLMVRPEGWTDLSPLAKLQPDDLYMVAFLPTPPGVAKAGDECMPYLARLTGLRILLVNWTDIGDRGVKLLKSLRGIEQLSVSNVGNAGLAEAANLRWLKGLYLGPNRVSDAGLAHLAKMTALEDLGLVGNEKMTGAGLAHLGKVRRLKRLVFGGEKFRDADAALAHLKRIPSLRELSLGPLPVTEAGLAHLSALTRLEKLFLFELHLTDQSLACLRPMRSLKKLGIKQGDNRRPDGGFLISDAGLAHLKDVTSLEYLLLPNFGISDQGLSHLSGLVNLKNLAVAGYTNAPVTDAGLAHLAKLRSLEELVTGGGGITDDGMAQLAKLPNLKSLFLLAPKVTDAGLAEIAACKSLSRLQLGGAKVSILGLSHLNALSSLTELEADNVTQDYSGLKIAGLTRLEKLHVHGPLRDEDLACLAKLTGLKWLIMDRKSSISDKGLAHLAGLTAMHQLVVSGPGISDEGLVHLANMKKLGVLTMRGNFTDKGLKHLEGLEKLGILTIASGNPLSVAAIERLRSQLPFGRTGIFQVEGNVNIGPAPKTLNIGDAAPSFTAKSLDGRTIKLQDYRGKVVLLYFWSTFCKPCVASTPALKKLHEELSKHKDFAMISLSLDDADVVVQQHVQQFGLTWPQVCLGSVSKVAADYGVEGLPAYFVIGPDGRIISTDTNWRKLTDAIDQAAKRDR